MTTAQRTDWSPETYARFRGLRLRPALDLLWQVPALPDGDVVDLGCGNGAVAEALKLRFGRCLIGVDTSPAMLERARSTGHYDRLTAMDAGDWAPETAPALIFSNAMFQWLPDHEAVFARLAGSLAPGGTLAVQMPRQYAAPSHALLRSLAEQMFPDRFDFAGWQPPVRAPADYLAMLSVLGEADVWETQYMHSLPRAEAGHPVRHFTQATAMRPFMEKLDPEEQRAFISAYDAALDAAYPIDKMGRVIMPFRRVFLRLTL